jgi:hypothetical protein
VETKPNAGAKVRGLALLFFLLALSGCKVSSWYPLGGSAAGAAGGAAFGGPAGALGGSVVGYSLGAAAQLADKNPATATALASGDIAAIVAAQVKDQNSGFDSFLGDLKKILMIAASVLLVYLSIPFFYTRSCLKKQKEELTRAPFPVRPTKK